MTNCFDIIMIYDVGLLLLFTSFSSHEVYRTHVVFKKCDFFFFFFKTLKLLVYTSGAYICRCGTLALSYLFICFYIFSDLIYQQDIVYIYVCYCKVSFVFVSSLFLLVLSILFILYTCMYIRTHIVLFHVSRSKQIQQINL